MLDFGPVVEKKQYARSREILTFRFSGNSKQIEHLLAMGTSMFSTVVENSVEKPRVGQPDFRVLSLWISGNTSSQSSRNIQTGRVLKPGSSP